MGNTKQWSLNTTETGKSCGSNSGHNFNVYIAKVLPLVSFSNPEVKPVAIQKSCFINADDCKPSISTEVKTKNYLTLSLSTNANINSAGHGADLKITVQNKNVDKMYVEGTANN